ncbi:hypothetical protein [Sphingomonas crusticola]|uniref:hypothetical protein n=1 Tax=Sphingomonas crusticola TaxID=1697973 RepID=UPI000E2599E0|nr:hypothetical protein [Sphingomonas crusticola]
MYMLGPNYQQLNAMEATTDAEQGEMIRHILRLLRPQQVKGFEKVRVGAGHDGAYVMLNDFTGIDVALSFGINDNIEWDKVMADKGILIHQFDHTVDDPAPRDPRMFFNRTMIGPEKGAGVESISSLVAQHDRGDARPNMILKMDIECWEWPTLEATLPETLGRFSQIVCELHGFTLMYELGWRQQIFRGLRKLAKTHAPIHIHANNYGGGGFVSGVAMPSVVEVCYVNRALYEVAESTELFPTELDLPCNPDQADIWLGRFEY